MTARKPQQPAARERLAARIRVVGVVLDSLVRQAGPLPDVYSEHVFHVEKVARLAGIPESSLRSIAWHSFTDIQVPGHVVGWSDNRFRVALDGNGRK